MPLISTQREETLDGEVCLRRRVVANRAASFKRSILVGLALVGLVAAGVTGASSTAGAGSQTAATGQYVVYEIQDVATIGPLELIALFHPASLGPAGIACDIERTEVVENTVNLVFEEDGTVTGTGRLQLSCEYHPGCGAVTRTIDTRYLDGRRDPAVNAITGQVVFGWPDSESTSWGTQDFGEGCGPRWTSPGKEFTSNWVLGTSATSGASRAGYEEANIGGNPDGRRALFEVSEQQGPVSGDAAAAPPESIEPDVDTTSDSGEVTVDDDSSPPVGEAADTSATEPEGGGTNEGESTDEATGAEGEEEPDESVDAESDGAPRSERDEEGASKTKVAAAGVTAAALAAVAANAASGDDEPDIDPASFPTEPGEWWFEEADEAEERQLPPVLDRPPGQQTLPLNAEKRWFRRVWGTSLFAETGRYDRAAEAERKQRGLSFTEERDEIFRDTPSFVWDTPAGDHTGVVTVLHPRRWASRADTKIIRDRFDRERATRGLPALTREQLIEYRNWVNRWYSWQRRNYSRPTRYPRAGTVGSLRDGRTAQFTPTLASRA